MAEKTNKLGKRFWLAMIIFALMGQVAWVVENMYFNVFIYKMFNASAQDISNMVMASAVMAAVTTIIMGAVSDKVGKRKAFMSFGYILWGVSIITFAYIESVWLTIVMDCVMTFFGSTANDAAYNAWITDCGDEHNRGKIEGLNSMMPLIAILVVFGGFMNFNLDTHEAWTKIYYIIGIATTLIGIAGLFLVQDAKNLQKETKPLFDTILFGFKPKTIRSNKELYLVLFGFAIFGMSIQVFMPYLIIYYEKTLEMTDYVLILAPAIIAASVVTFFYGKLYDKLRYRKTISYPLLMLLCGYILLFFFRTKLPVLAGSFLMMSGYLCGMAVFGAKIRELIPENQSGQFQGVRIICQVFIPGLIGPEIGALVLRDATTILNEDGTTSFKPTEMIWLAALVVVILLFLYLLFTRQLTSNKDKAN